MDVNNTASSFWIEVMLSVIGALSLLVLSGVAWFLKSLHKDMGDLKKAIDLAAEQLRNELDDIADKANMHHTTLYGAYGQNGLTGDIRAIKDIIYERRLHPRE